MIQDFADFCTWMYTIVDDIWQEISSLFARPGPASLCSDSELMAMVLIGECRGWDKETEMLSCWREHRDLFPHIPSQSRFNRRRRNLSQALNLIRQLCLQELDLAQDRQCVIDSLPIPVVQFHLVPQSTGDWRAFGARFGKVSSKKQTIFGYKLYLLVTLGGVILDFELAPANAAEIDAGFELLGGHRALLVLGDKGFISAEKAEELWRLNRLRLCTLPRRNQTNQPSARHKRLFNAARQIIETVNGQLSEQLYIEQNHAHSFSGLCARIYAKLTAHTLCVYINRLLGAENPLQIKRLAFN
jgi:hypothetical protein